MVDSRGKAFQREVCIQDQKAGRRAVAELPKEIAEKLVAMRVDFVRRAKEHGELLKSCASVLTRDRPARLDPTLLLRVEESAHKLHGSGATFGFAALSEAAGALEDLVSEGNAGSRAIEDAPASAAVLQAIERVLARIPRSTDLPKP